MGNDKQEKDMRNKMFAGHLVNRFNATYSAYVGCLQADKPLTAKKHLITMQRIRMVLEYRYNVIL